MSRASSVPDTAQARRNNMPDLLKACPVKVYVKRWKVTWKRNAKSLLDKHCLSVS